MTEAKRYNTIHIMETSFLLEEQTGQYLKQKGWMLCLAESCTGGLISDRITNVAGSSEYYAAGICTYSYEAKEQLLGVKSETLAKYGAVSAQTVAEMALGIRKAVQNRYPLTKTVGLSVSGIAGPGGGLYNKPVGSVWVGVSAPHGSREQSFFNQGNRLENKQFFARKALEFLMENLNAFDIAGQKIHILSTRKLEQLTVPEQFIWGGQTRTIVDYGRHGTTPEGFTIHARLSDHSVVELKWYPELQEWKLLKSFPAASLL